MSRVHGDMPRPRAGLIGFDEETINAFRAVFRTVYSAVSASELRKLISEVDVDIVVARGEPAEWAGTNHCIVFGNAAHVDFDSPDGINEPYFLVPTVSIGHAFESGPADSFLGALQRAFATEIGTSARGRGVVQIGWQDYDEKGKLRYEIDEDETTRLAERAVLRASNPDGALALVTVRDAMELGIAWFPTPPSDQVGWTRGIVSLWSRRFPDEFPGVDDWESTKRWATAEEQRLIVAREQTRARRARIEAALDVRAAKIESRFLAARDSARRGVRRLLTATGDELVDATAEALAAFGFHVTNIDAARTDKNEAKREDLRIVCPDDPNWEAIVEVKGLERGNVRTEHVAKIARHAMRFALEKQREPSKQIFVCNGEYGLPPEARHRPFAGSPDDARAFAESNGVVIATTDLYEMQRDLGAALTVIEARQLLKSAAGVLQYGATAPNDA